MTQYLRLEQLTGYSLRLQKFTGNCMTALEATTFVQLVQSRHWFISHITPLVALAALHIEREVHYKLAVLTYIAHTATWPQYRSTNYITLVNNF